MNRLITGLALTALIASPALARTQAHRPAPWTYGYTSPALGDASTTAGYFDGKRLADPDPFVRNQLIREYENGEP